MLKEVKGMEKVYQIKTHLGYRYFVITDSIDELASFCAAKDKAGYIISSVCEMQPDGKTPRISIHSMPAYKEAKKKLYVDWQGNWMQLLVRKTTNGYEGINSLLNMDSGDIRLYAEIPDDEESLKECGCWDEKHEDVDMNAFDEYSYPLLKEEIIRQAKENNIPIEILEFHWD